MLHNRNVNGEIEHLDQLSRAELRELWKRELAEQPPSSLGRDILALGIAYARQERHYGGLSRPVAKELDRLLKTAVESLDWSIRENVLLYLQGALAAGTPLLTPALTWCSGLTLIY